MKTINDKSFIGLTEDNADKLFFLASKGMSDKEICAKFNLSIRELQDIYTKNFWIFEEIERLRALPSANAREKISEAIEAGDMQTVRWFMERINRDEFSTKQETSLSGQPLQIVVANSKDAEAVADLMGK